MGGLTEVCVIVFTHVSPSNQLISLCPVTFIQQVCVCVCVLSL